MYKIKNRNFFLLFVFLVSILITSCANKSDTEEIIINNSSKLIITGQLNTKISQKIIKRMETGSHYIVGSLKVTKVSTNETTNYNLRVLLNEDGFSINSYVTIIFDPNIYDFELTIQNYSTKYIGRSLGKKILEGNNNININLSPVIGNVQTQININDVSSLKIKYDPNELNVVSIPQIGIIIDNTNEVIFDINKDTGITSTFLNLTPGNHNIKLKLYDCGMQLGRSVYSQEDVIVGIDDIKMNIVPLYGEAKFHLAMSGAESSFTFKVPKEVIEEVNDISNLVSILKITGKAIGMKESVLILSPDQDGNFSGNITFSNMKYDIIGMSLQFMDSSQNFDIIGQCNVDNLELKKEEQSIVMYLNLRRRSLVTGNILGILGVNVFRKDNSPVNGAKIYANGKFIGISGSDYFEKPCFLKSHLIKGNYNIKAEYPDINNKSISILMNPLDILNKNIVFDE